jgi:hypothetical protein
MCPAPCPQALLAAAQRSRLQAGLFGLLEARSPAGSQLRCCGMLEMRPRELGSKHAGAAPWDWELFT